MSQVVAKAVHPAGQPQTVPFDRALPGSLLLHHPGDLIELLSSSLSDWLGNKTHILDVSTHVRGHKPGRRCIFELELILGSAGGNVTEHRRITGKLFASHRGGKVHETIEQLWSHGFATEDLNVPQPLAFDPDWQLLLLSWAQGESLNQLLLDQSDVSTGIVRSAEWLWKLHTCGVSKGRHYDFRRYLHKPAFWQRYLKVVYPEAEPLFAKILSYVELQGQMLSGWKNAPTHHDYSPDHVIVHNKQITGVDFDEFCQFDPLFDVAHFVVHLRYLGLIRFGALNRFDHLADLFLSTYKAYVDDYSVMRLRLFMLIAYLKMVQVNAFNQRTQDWKLVVDILLDEAHKIAERPKLMEEHLVCDGR